MRTYGKEMTAMPMAQYQKMSLKNKLTMHPARRQVSAVPNKAKRNAGNYQ